MRISVLTFSSMKPSRGPGMVRLVTIVLPAFFASAFASSFALRRLRKSSRHLECWTCSMRTWMRFLAMRPPICWRGKIRWGQLRA